MTQTMRAKSARGGAATKAKADPNYYKIIGAKGGRASKGVKKTKRRFTPATMQKIDDCIRIMRDFDLNDVLAELDRT